MTHVENSEAIRTMVMIVALSLLVVAPGSGQAAARVQAGDASAREIGARIASGQAHTCVVSGDGTVRCWGENAHGQLGDGTTKGKTAPVKVTGLINVVALAAGAGHTCALRADGTAVCWGLNDTGQLGDGTTTDRPSPTPVSGLTGAVTLVAGGGHTCALRADGTARCWGLNRFGQLGNGTTANQLTPVAVSGLSGVASLAAGELHTCARRADGAARCWGLNRFGQIGDGTTTNRPTAVAVSDPTDPTGDLTNVSSLTAGTGHTCALRADGVARCWGANESGQLGDGTTSAQSVPGTVNTGGIRVAALTAGAAHTCARRANGTAACWGSNPFGQVGNGTTVSQTLPSGVVALGRAVALAAGDRHTCAVLDDDTARCWGDNSSGQLGDQTTTNRSTPVPVAGIAGGISARAIAGGGFHTCARRSNGTAACWGGNGSGGLGDGTTTNGLTPVAVSGLTGTVGVATGFSFSCAVRGDGSAACWGPNGDGELGKGVFGVMETTPVAVTGLAEAVAMEAGFAHACALRVDGTVRCWGNNLHGDLGIGNTTDEPAPVTVTVPVPPFGSAPLTGATAVAADVDHSCALLVDGTAMCWGANASGQVGDGTTIERRRAVPVSVLTDTVALAAGVAGVEHTCALGVDGTVRCWGLGNFNEIALTPVVATALTDTVALAVGEGHICALRAGGTVACWGRNASGQLGDGTTADRFAAADVLTTVIGESGPVNVVLQNIVAIAAGRRHTCAVRADGQPFCWGLNEDGRVGDGTTTNRLTATLVPSFRFNIDPTVELEGRHAIATVTTLLNCPEGQRFTVHVSLTQARATGEGHGAGTCAGGLERHPVTVVARGRFGFAPGAAQAAAEVTVRDLGTVVDVQEWARAVTLESD